MVLDIWTISILGIQEVDPGWVGRIAVSYEDDLLAGSSRPDRLAHGDDGGLSVPAVRNVIGGDLQVLGRDEEKDKVVLPQDPDVGLIASLDGIDRAFVLEIEAVAVKRRGSRIVQDRLIRDLDIEDGLQNNRGFPGWNSEGDVKGKDQAEDILGVMDFRQLDDGFLRGRVHQFLGLVMILPVLVAELEL